MSLYYKYLPIERIDYLENELLRFTQPVDLNDPFECIPQRPTKTELKDAIEKVSKKLPNVNVKEDVLNIEKLFNSAYQNVNNDIGIFSLTKNWNNTLMWAHYTESHKGFCVGFNSKDEFFNDYLSTDLEQSKTVKEVVYSNERVKIPMELDTPRLGFKPFITKSTDWAYEKEIRIISTLNLSDKICPKPPFDIHLFKIPHKAISEIIVGANIAKNNEIIIKEFCIKNKIDFYNSKVSDRLFDMERIK